MKRGYMYTILLALAGVIMLAMGNPVQSQSSGRSALFRHVPGWTGTFTIKATDSANGLVNGTPAHWVIERHASGTVHLDQFDPSLDGWVGTVEGSAAIMEKIVLNWGDCIQTTVSSASQGLQTDGLGGRRKVLLTFDIEREDTYSLWFNDPYVDGQSETNFKCPDGTTEFPPQQQGLAWSPLGRSEHIPLPAVGLTLSGSKQVEDLHPFQESPLICEVTWNLTPVGLDPDLDPLPKDPDSPPDDDTTNPANLGPDLTGSWTRLVQTRKVSKATRLFFIKGTLNVRNQGTQSAGNSVLKFYLSSDATPDARDTVLKRVTVSALAPGGATSKKLQVKGRTNRSGEYVIAVVDATNAVAETDELNNVIVFGPIP